MGLTFESTQNRAMTDLFKIEKKKDNASLHLQVIQIPVKALFLIHLQDFINILAIGLVKQ